MQRYGSSLNLNVHNHSIFLDGVYLNPDAPRFLRLPLPTNEEVASVTQTIAKRVLRWFAKQGFGENDEFEDPDSLKTYQAASIRYRIGIGSRAGQKIQAFGTYTNAFVDPPELKGQRCASVDGFSVHANTACKENQRKKLEKLCRYIARPPIALNRLSVTNNGKVVFELKRAYSNGTTHLIFTPEEFLEKIAAIIPPPRINLIRYHGVLAPHAKVRSKIVPEPPPHDDKKAQSTEPGGSENKYYISWAKLLRRIFDIDIKTCPNCGAKMRILKAVLKRDAIEKILIHLKIPTQPPTISPARPPPQTEFYFE